MPNKEISGVLSLESQSPLQSYNRLLGVAIGSSSSKHKGALTGFLKRGNYAALLAWSDTVNPQLYGSPSEYFTDAQIQSLIKKYPFTKVEVPGLDPEATAMKKFYAAEHSCKRVNQKRRARRKRLDPYMQFRIYAQDYITSVLGAMPDFTAIYDLCDFTAGASVGVHGEYTNVARKIYSDSWTCTPPALFHAKRALWNNIHTRDCILPGAIKCYDIEQFDVLVKERVERVDHNKISLVPKTAKTHRVIAVEPLLNGFVQKGADEYIRRRLRKRTQVDLSDQTINQALARVGSLADVNPYCTIDLSAASDTLSTEVVRDLVPPAWFEFLTEIRAPYYRLASSDASVRYEKFCSMGNGFCFPLQTLIFMSICYAALRSIGDDPHDFVCYGDDIVVRQNVALLVIELLREFGFRVNVDKTFITGPFRESCGADWYHGQDVRPVFLKKPLLDVQEAYSLHNTFLRSPIAEAASVEVRQAIIDLVPPRWRYMRPGRESGDGAFSVPLDVAMCSAHVKWVRDREPYSQTWTWREVLTRSTKDPGIRTLSEVERANVLLLAAMRGSSSQNPFPVRYTTTRTVITVGRPLSERFNEENDTVLGLTPLDSVGSVRAYLRG